MPVSNDHTKPRCDVLGRKGHDEKYRNLRVHSSRNQYLHDYSLPPPKQRRHEAFLDGWGECKTIILNRFGNADHNRIPITPSSRGFFVLRDGT